MKEFNKLYTILGVSFDVEYGESFYNDRTAELIERMQKNGIAVEDDGALVVKLDKNNLPPVIIRKTDGATLYHTRDIANIEYRLGEYHPDKILYVVGNEQTLHFQQLFAVAELMGIGVTKLEHIKYGLLLDESGKKFATREGRATLADELIDQAIKLASDIIGDKNPKMATEQKARTAEAIGISALKYALLKDHRNTDIVFSWEQILDFNGNSGPYLQYTYARFAKILASASPVGRESVKTELLVGPTELDLIKKIIDLPDILERAVAQRLTNGLTLYLYELAVMANSYYEKTHILGGENRQLQEARLLLIKNVLRAMAKCFELLNLTILEEV